MHKEIPEDELALILWFLDISYDNLEGIVADLKTQIALLNQQERLKREEEAFYEQSEDASSGDFDDANKKYPQGTPSILHTVSVFTRARELEIIKTQPEEREATFFEKRATGTSHNKGSGSPGTSSTFGEIHRMDTSSGPPVLSPTWKGLSTLPFSDSKGDSDGKGKKSLRRFESLPEVLPSSVKKHSQLQQNQQQQHHLLNGTWGPSSNSSMISGTFSNSVGSPKQLQALNTNVPSSFSSSSAFSRHPFSPQQFNGYSPSSTTGINAEQRGFLGEVRGGRDQSSGGNAMSTSAHTVENINSDTNQSSFAASGGGRRVNLRSVAKRGANGNRRNSGALTQSQSMAATASLAAYKPNNSIFSSRSAPVSAKKKLMGSNAWQTQTQSQILSSQERSLSETSSTSQTLRMELLRSLRSMQEHTNLVSDSRS
jgi:hypothetical protein